MQSGNTRNMTRSKHAYAHFISYTVKDICRLAQADKSLEYREDFILSLHALVIRSDHIRQAESREGGKRASLEV